MMYFIRHWDDDTVILFSQSGHMIGLFECVESAEDAARHHTVDCVRDRSCDAVFPLTVCTNHGTA
jgi:hypothetical protein